MRALLRLTLVAALLALTGCAASPPGPPPSSAPPSTPTPTPTPTVDPIADLSLEQRVGQLFMVGTSTSAATPATIAAVSKRHAGSIFLHGVTTASTGDIASLVRQFTGLVDDASTGGVPLWIATDQEGGEVQVLHGSGFDRMPSALQQGRLPAAQLQSDATGWGRELAAAGLNMNLAPVAAIVTSPQTAAHNPPIGALDRQYGFDEQTVTAGAGAFAQGMRDAGIVPTIKHFPGLGHVGKNTDTSANVVDTVIGPDSPEVDVYRTLLSQGPAVVMVSSAIYDKIDASSPAVFSPTVVTGLLRGQLGFQGVVMTDDVSAAVAVAAWTPPQRAVLALQAGVDVILLSNRPGEYTAMYDAVLAKAKADPAFAQLVDAAARRVVEAKTTGP